MNQLYKQHLQQYINHCDASGGRSTPYKTRLLAEDECLSTVIQKGECTDGVSYVFQYDIYNLVVCAYLDTNKEMLAYCVHIIDPISNLQVITEYYTKALEGLEPFSEEWDFTLRMLAANKKH
ncbi:hypothetical protein ACKC5Q_12915 [Aeromonas dhakensis]|uniref:hypothetical protein n=1 Tax=Aeromonas dhakensis TaxID=196024 RepID=UPI0038B5CE95